MTPAPAPMPAHARAAMAEDPGRFWAALAGDARVRWGVGPGDPALAGLSAVYLATPYTLRATGRDGRFDLAGADAAAAQASAVLGVLLLRGVGAFAPIVQSHAMIRDHLLAAAGRGGGADRAAIERLALDGAFWWRANLQMLSVCRAIWVPMIAGWDESAGIRAEVAQVLATGHRPVLIEAPAFALEGWR